MGFRVRSFPFRRMKMSHEVTYKTRPTQRRVLLLGAVSSKPLVSYSAAKTTINLASLC